FVTRLYVEGRVPGIEIAHRGGTVHCRGVADGHEELAQRFVMHRIAPTLCVAEEELLLGGETGTAGGVVAQRTPAIERRGDAGNVREIFRQGLFAVHANAGERTVATVLLDQLRRRSAEMRKVFRRPPVRHPAISVELAALIVEAVADLVPDRGADR